MEQDVGELRPLLSRRFHHAEGPIWDETHDRLLFVDMLRGDLVAVSVPETTLVSTTHIADLLAFIRPRQGGGWVAATADSLIALDADLVPTDRTRVLDDPTVRFNDGGCDHQGRLYAGTMRRDKQRGGGTLYRTSSLHGIEAFIEGVTISNGVAAASESALFYVDSAEYSIQLVDVEDGSRSTFALIDPDLGQPDGLTIDDRGGVWVAIWGGGCVLRFDRTGELTHRLALPTPNVTSCAFGGLRGSQLFVTTSQVGLESGHDPWSGCIFIAETIFRGVPPTGFAF